MTVENRLFLIVLSLDIWCFFHEILCMFIIVAFQDILIWLMKCMCLVLQEKTLILD